MNMPIPVSEVTDGPEWAADIQDSLTIIDSHTHAAGSGVPITPSGLNINTDLLINSNNLTLVNSVVFSTHTGTPDFTSIYADGTNLYFKDGSGNLIQITSGGNVNAGAGSITGLPSGTAGVAYGSLTGTYTFTQATSTAANIDAATLIVRYPGSYPTPSGNFIAIQAPSALATGYSITLPLSPPPSSNYLVIMDSSGVLSTLTTDNTTVTVGGGTLHVVSGGIGTTQLANSSVTTAKIADANVTTVKIADANVTAAKIEDNVNLNGTNVRLDGLSGITMASDTASAFKIIRGVVTAGGTIVGAQSENFSITSHTTGGYALSWASNQFSGVPAVIVGIVDTAGRTARVSSVTTTGCTVNTASTTSPFSDADTAFSFIAIGPR